MGCFQQLPAENTTSECGFPLRKFEICSVAFRCGLSLVDQL
uniref:Uncharacterized protein n=1 Tax=Arundo donax TaxID=35708 RepID=A0A0A9FZK0_ARUDO